MEGRKLTKGRARIICGVCSGIAEYLGCDATIIRIAAVLLTLAYGGGIIAYIIGALLMPNATPNYPHC